MAKTIRQIIDSVYNGQIRIPAFQRGFVWEPDRVAYLMDSIYKRYPFGQLLFWRTDEKLKVERDLGPFKMPALAEDYPVDYVLDGQQRITSIFGVFQTELKPEIDIDWLDVYFDLLAEENAQDTQFVALPDEEIDPNRHFPLKALFDTVAYRAATKDLNEDVAKKIDDMQSVFKETQIPIQTTDTKDKVTVAIIFERVNRQGVELDTLQLLSAWTWSEDFQLQEQFSDLSEELQPFGFSELSENTNLLLRCCFAVLKGDASPQALMEMNGAEVREGFERVVNGVRYAVDYLKNNFGVETLSNLPFSTQLVPLSVFFAVPNGKEIVASNAQREAINKWFWRSSFSKRYSSGVLRNLNSDIEGMKKLREGGDIGIADITFNFDDGFFIQNRFGINNVNTKSFVLLLATKNSRSFISGEPINIKEKIKMANRNEFHHMMPRAFLKDTGQAAYNESVLANFCFMSRADNRNLGGDAPSVYRAKMQGNVDLIMDSCFSNDTLFDDDFEGFVIERSVALATKVKELCGI
ncbi:DUF262 domain-containing protein [Mesorhizobium ciceri]|uniref:DUF262 domain-containing protein n=1 Tax=Mesorhizobium TaxID=68287 RepID=UPI0004B7557A|nr:DUF262 domain-containing protein [Mesorhizobium ciceri]